MPNGHYEVQAHGAVVRVTAIEGDEDNPNMVELQVTGAADQAAAGLTRREHYELIGALVASAWVFQS
jgi:hypothetical protein